MSKNKINFAELLEDIDKAFDLLDKIDNDELNMTKITSKAKKLKNNLEKKYSKYLDSKK